MQRQIERRRHRLVTGARQQRGGDIRPIHHEGTQLVRRQKHPHVIERPRHPLLAQQHRHQPHGCAIGLHYVPAPVGDDGGKRLVPPQQQIDGALGVGDFGRGEIALAILPGKTARLQQRVAVAQGQTERGRQLQQDVAAARGLAGFDIAQMLDRDAGLERQIGLAHGAAVAPAAQEVADGIDG